MKKTPLGEAFRAHARSAPDSPAIIEGSTTITHADLDARTNGLARALQDRGVHHGSYVTLALSNGVEFLETVIAIWKIGAIPQPVSSRLSVPESKAILDLVDPALLIGLDRERAGGRAWLPEGYSASVSAPVDALPPATPPSWKAPTSGGSTGRPKVIVAGERGIVEDLAIYTDMYRMSADTVLLCTGPLYHNGPFNTSMLALVAGGCVVVMPRFDAEETLRLVDEHRVTWLYIVPTMMHRISQLPDSVRLAHDVSMLEMVMHTAAPCPAWLKREWIDWLGPYRIVEIYGGTEAQMMTFIDGGEWLRNPGSVGRPAFGEIRIMDDGHRPCLVGQRGGVWMRRGPDAPPTYFYLGAEPVRAASGWEWLGDNGSLNDDGYLFVADRSTDMILVGGANVYPAELEAALDLHPAIESSCVVGVPDDDLGNVPHAVVRARETVTEDELREHMAQQVGPQKRPRSYEFVDHPLRDDAGKVRRPEVRERALERLAGTSSE